MYSTQAKCNVSNSATRSNEGLYHSSPTHVQETVYPNDRPKAQSDSEIKTGILKSQVHALQANLQSSTLAQTPANIQAQIPKIETKALISKLSNDIKLCESDLTFLRRNFLEIIEKKESKYKHRTEDQDLGKVVRKWLEKFMRKQSMMQEFEQKYIILWVQVIRQFLRECSFIKMGIVLDQCVQHIQANKGQYLNQNQHFSPQLIIKQGLFSNHNPFQIQVESFTFKTICKQIQKQILFRCHSINLVLSNLTKSAYRALIQANPTLTVSNLLQSLKEMLTFNQLTNFSEIQHGDVKILTKNKLAEQIIDSLIILSLKQKQWAHDDWYLFTQQKICEFFEFVDHISHKTTKSIQKKLVTLLNQILYKNEYNSSQWSSSLKISIKNSKSSLLEPFRMVFEFEKKRISNVSLKRIIGSQWEGVCKNYIILTFENQELEIHCNFQSVLFELVCSIIDEDPVQFWTNPQKYAIIYAYISAMGTQLLSQNPINRTQLGRVIRLMICMLPPLPSQTDDPDPELAFKSFVSLLFEEFPAMDIQTFFTKFIFPELNGEQTEIRPNNITDIKYHQIVPFCCNQLILKIGINCPQVLKEIFKYFDRSHFKKYQSHPSHYILYSITFKYLQQLHYQNQQAQHSQVSNSPFLSMRDEIVPIIFKFMNSALNSEELKTIMVQLFASIIENNSKNIIHSDFLAYIFVNLLTTEETISAFTDHIIVLYKNNLHFHKWNTQLLLPTLFDEMLPKWQISSFKFYAKIFTAILQKCLQSDNPHPETLQSIQDSFSSLTLTEKNTKFDSLFPMTKQFFKQSEHLLKFINWSFQIQGNSTRYFNLLYEKKNYDVLLAALGLFFSLMKFYEKFSCEYFIPEKVRKYFSIFQFERNAFLNSQGQFKASYNYSNVKLSNDRIVTLPGALLHLAVSDKSAAASPEETHKVETILKLTLDILSCLILQNKENSLEIDFKIYHSNFDEEFPKYDCPVEQILYPYLMSCLLTKKKQSESFCGEMIDLLSCLTNFKESEKVSGLLQVLNFRTKALYQSNSLRQTQSLSRALLPLTNCLRSEILPLQDPLQTTINNILALITFQIQKSLKKIKSLSTTLITNYFRCLRLLQLDSQTRPFFANLIQKYAHLIFHPSLFKQSVFKISANIYKNSETSQIFSLQKLATGQYFSCLQIILCCGTYLTQEEMLIVQKAENLSEILKTLVRELIQHPKLYMLLNYAIFWLISRKEDDFLKKRHSSLTEHMQRESVEKVLGEGKNFERLSVFCLMLMINNLDLNLKVSQRSPEDILIEWDQRAYHDLRRKKSEHLLTDQFIPESILFNVIQDNSTFMLQKAIRMNYLSSHHLTFISTMHYLYTQITESQQHLSQSDVHAILNHIQLILKIKADMLQRRMNLYMKAWACTILNAILAIYYGQEIYERVVKLMLEGNTILGPLGMLLQGYGRCPLQWSFFMRSSKKYQGLSLLEKEYLLSILKAVSTWISKISEWGYLIGFNQKNSRNPFKKQFNELCRAFIQSIRILKPNYPGSNNSSHFSKTKHNLNMCHNQYEETLQSIKLSVVIQQTLHQSSNLLQKNISESAYSAYISRISSQNTNTSISAYLNQTLFPTTPDCLDLIHEHFDLLIVQRFLMVVSICYDNKEVGVFEYDEILWVIQSLVSRLKVIGKQEKVYQEIQEFVNRKIWESCNMSDQLHFLNLIEEPIEDNIQLYNSALEVGVSVCVKLKKEMEIHKEYPSFMRDVTRLMHLMNSLKGMFKFDVHAYVERGGFLDKNMYGLSYMSATNFK